MKKSMTTTLLAMTLSLTSLNALAQSGEKKLFTMEKDHNEENVMMIHTQTDADCKFVTSTKNSEKNYMEFYWIMNNGKDTKEVHSMIRSSIKERVKFLGINASRDSFKIKLNDLSELRHDLTDTTMEINSEMVNGKCEVKSVLTLGASGRYRKIDLNRTFCNVSKNLIGVPNGCNFIELEGSDTSTGETIKVKFKKK